MKNRNVFIALIVAALLILSSCNNNKVDNNIINSNNKPKNVVTLNFSTFYEDGAQADAYKKIIEAFENSHSNIKVNLQTGSINYDEKIKTALESEKGPDIIGLQRNKMLQYAKQGNLKDISSWVQSQDLKSKYFGVNMGYGKSDGKYYGVGDLPYTVEWYYNVDLFKRAGVSEPKNLDELINTCNKLKNYTQTPIMLGAKDPWVVNTFLGMITTQLINTEELSSAYVSGNKQLFETLNGANNTIDIVDRLIKNGAFQRKVTDYDYTESIDYFVKGKSAILPMGSWGIEKIEKTKPKGFNYKAFDKPVNFVSYPNSAFSATAVQVITVNEKSKNSKEAMEFMTYLFGEEAQKIFADMNGISGMKSINATSQNPLKKQVIEHLELTNENSTVYMDNISKKMMDVTASRLLELINGDLKPGSTWKLIVDETHS